MVAVYLVAVAEVTSSISNPPKIRLEPSVPRQIHPLRVPARIGRHHHQGNADTDTTSRLRWFLRLLPSSYLVCDNLCSPAHIMPSSASKRRRNLLKAQQKKALKVAVKKESQFVKILPQIREVTYCAFVSNGQL